MAWRTVLLLLEAALAKKSLDAGLDSGYEQDLIKELSQLAHEISQRAGQLEEAVGELSGTVEEQGYTVRDVLLKHMKELRMVCDRAETITAKEFWPYPSYGDILFSVR